MTPFVAASALVASLSAVGLMPSQDRVNFSGRWTPVSATRTSQVLVVVHDSTSLAAELVDGAVTEKIRFSFAGTTMQDVLHPDVEVVSTASWKDAAMSGTSTFRSRSSKGVLSVREETWSLDAEGRLVIDVATKRNNGQTSTARSIYRRE